jgi:hypothetical protein
MGGEEDPKTSGELFTRWKMGEYRQARLHEEYAFAFATLAASGLPMPVRVTTDNGWLGVSWVARGGFGLVSLHHDYRDGKYWWRRLDDDGDETFSQRGTLHECLIAVMRELGCLEAACDPP